MFIQNSIYIPRHCQVQNSSSNSFIFFLNCSKPFIVKNVYNQVEFNTSLSSPSWIIYIHYTYIKREREKERATRLIVITHWNSASESTCHPEILWQPPPVHTQPLPLRHYSPFRRILPLEYNLRLEDTATIITWILSIESIFPEGNI